ncbi:hypothetical protein [Microbacterium dextranolyticum]|uniref:Uncharacterized protein n=1 Tax=Microbacterium dextranolyticum TaxID=36806 RepID=A0A9W6HM31_9MICO|nr:hypothetical protein [Microbacterium dextranolyticum]MBM7463188.1 hypothetical protein [Microbacterium dextranolyticum]GLJ95706.1 hypothetical protein GCM10017591_17690 [Microbacterium dextranolyticum]
MSFYDQRDIARWSANGRAATRLAGRSAGWAILADRPRHVERDGLSVVEQVLATALVLVMGVVTGVLWSTAPLAGGVLGLLGTYFVTRRVAAFSQTPLRVRAFFRLLRTHVPAWWVWSSLSLVAASVLYRSVTISFLPAWLQSLATGLAGVALLVNLLPLPVFLGRLAVRDARATAQAEAEIEASLAAMLGGTPRALFEPRPETGIPAASWGYGEGAAIVVTPHVDVDLTALGERLARTKLGQHFEIADADYQRVLLIPISAETFAKQQARAASGGLIEGESDLSQPAPVETVTALDEDDPWGASEPSGSPAGENSDIPTFDEKDWT